MWARMVSQPRISLLWRKVSGFWLSATLLRVAGLPLGLPASLRLLFLLPLLLTLFPVWRVMGVGLRGMMRW